MFYDPARKNHGLPHDPFKSLIIPRPIGWISTLGLDGVVNVAPYSHFNICSIEPHAVMFSSGAQFVVNIATYDLREQMNGTSAPMAPDESEAEITGLEMIASTVVKPPRVKASPIQLECKHLMSIVLPCATPGGDRNTMVIGQVLGVHIADWCLKDGIIDVETLKPLSRLGYMQYGVTDRVFEMQRPGR